MNQIITIGREFGSGGREIGRRLAEKLKFAYYDQEIITEMVKRTHFTEEYIQRIEENGVLPLLPITVGRTFITRSPHMQEQGLLLFTEQSKIIKEMAKQSDCVIVGRCANYVLREYQPFRIFVYADMNFKIARSRKKGKELTNLSDKELKKKILSVDKSRAKYHQFCSNEIWGEKSNYDLCINTSLIDIKDSIYGIKKFVKK
ncbi:cytidylate kinase-like family protein [Tissierella carlieri]|uniref:Cytidylate kinase-like family protein n=1 Tax=Tissierella carlieri TaxID=689904 RepID=A0ABT1S898_9FIRM|nr:cytidylate kinase-like family protein [Tissierella carlieri]MCQ4922247.1 cytidylate kinase-like family protein [Tissierella carlieri]